MSNEAAWGDLPNAAHIARVLEHVKAHPDKWSAALDAAMNADWDADWDAALDAARHAALDAAYDASRGAAMDAVWDAAMNAALDVVWDAVRGAVAPLVVWDEAGDILKLPPAEVKSLADQGVHVAVLLYPAVLAMEVIE